MPSSRSVSYSLARILHLRTHLRCQTNLRGQVDPVIAGNNMRHKCTNSLRNSSLPATLQIKQVMRSRPPNCWSTALSNLCSICSGGEGFNPAPWAGSSNHCMHLAMYCKRRMPDRRPSCLLSRSDHTAACMSVMIGLNVSPFRPGCTELSCHLQKTHVVKHTCAVSEWQASSCICSHLLAI